MGKEGTLLMVGGTGDRSYFCNSTFLRRMYESVQDMIANAIQTKLDLAKLNDTIGIADLGCAVGPNTLCAVQNTVDAFMAAIYKKSALDPQHQHPEFQVFFNDQLGNDFNLLFSTLPADRPYFAAAVPGSFYSRLFPRGSVHFFNSSFSLHWLSKAPEGVVNKGRSHCYGGGPAVRNAYLAQFKDDMDVFLTSRAEELVPAGLIALMIGSHEPGGPNMPIDEFYGIILDPIFHKLLFQGKVEEEELDSFQIPLYFPTVEELKGVIDHHGRYTVHTAEVIEWSKGIVEWGGTDVEQAEVRERFIKTAAASFRAAHDEVIKKHFGVKITEEFFEMLPGQIGDHVAKTGNPTGVLPQMAFFILQFKA